MNPTPETRASLLIRVRDPANQTAWHEFVEIYRPVILRLARQKGMQEADAEDVAQEVLVTVAKAVEQREHDRKRAKFRTWLHRVAHNAILNALTRGKPDRGSGDSALLAVLNQHESHTGPDSEQPDDRFASAREVGALLEECLAHVQQPTTAPLPAALPKPVPRRAWWPPAIRFKGVLAMIAALGAGLLGVLLVSTAAPDIAGQWSGDDWGQVVLKKTSDAEYTGTYSDTVSKQPGEIQLKWSRIERRFNGTWREGEDLFGELSVRLSGEAIRGALTTDPKSKINPATPRLADLTWIRAKPAAPLVFGPVIERVIATSDADDQGIVFFDLETGKSFKPPFPLKFYPNTPPVFVELTPELVQWIKARDVDVLYHLVERNWDMMTLGMQENYAGELKEWETLSPDEVVRIFAQRDALHLVRDEEPSSTFGHSSRDGFGSFDAFMTRSNTMGVYRFEDVDMSKSTSGGVRIRYKLVQYTPLTPGAVGGEQDLTVAELRGLGAQLVAKGEAGNIRAEKPADFTSISYSISHPLGGNVPEQIEVMADGSCVYTIQKRPARGQEKERPSRHQTFNLSSANLRRLHDAGAEDAKSARRLNAMGLADSLVFRYLRFRGVVRDAESGQYYLDAEAERNFRRKRLQFTLAVLSFGVVVIASLVILFVLRR